MPAWQGGCAPHRPAVQAQQPLAQLWPHAQQQQPGSLGALQARPWDNAAHAGGGAWLTGVQSGHSALRGAQQWHALPHAEPPPAGPAGAAAGWEQGRCAGAGPGSRVCSGGALLRTSNAGSEWAGAAGAGAAATALPGSGIGRPASQGAGSGPGSEELRLLPGGHTWRPGPTAPQAGANPARAAPNARQTNLLQGGRADGAISALHGARRSSQAWAASCFHAYQPVHLRQIMSSHCCCSVPGCQLQMNSR